MQADELVAERLEQQLRVAVDRRLDRDPLGRERARDDVERLLRAGRDDDLVGFDVEAARLQPLRDRLAQRPIALRVVVTRHPLAQHRARALGEPLGRQQIRIDEHGRQRGHAARRQIGTRRAAAGPRSAAAARRSARASRSASPRARTRLRARAPRPGRARPARRTRPAPCSSRGRAVSRARVPAATGCPPGVRRRRSRAARSRRCRRRSRGGRPATT